MLDRMQNGKRAAAVVVVAVTASTSAIAQARFAPGDVVSQAPRPAISNTQLNQIDELGPKHLDVHPSTAPAAAAKAPSSSFGWADTGIGLGSAAFALAIAAVGRVVLIRRRREASPEPGTLVGT